LKLSDGSLNKDCVLFYTDMILQYTGGFFSAHGWQSWADVILRIKNDDEMIYDCSKEAIEDFYFFKDNFTRLYE